MSDGVQVRAQPKTVVAVGVSISRADTHDPYWQKVLAIYVEPNTPEKWDMRSIDAWCSHKHRTPRAARQCRQRINGQKYKVTTQ